jgi:hypothetical protein
MYITTNEHFEKIDNQIYRFQYPKQSMKYAKILSPLNEEDFTLNFNK